MFIPKETAAVNKQACAVTDRSMPQWRSRRILAIKYLIFSTPVVSYALGMRLSGKLDTAGRSIACNRELRHFSCWVYLERFVLRWLRHLQSLSFLVSNAKENLEVPLRSVLPCLGHERINLDRSVSSGVRCLICFFFQGML